VRDGPWAWLGTYVGSSGLVLVGIAMFIAAHADWLPALFFGACGVAALGLSFSRQRDRERTRDP
jgi:hypothetical protein